MSHIHSMDFEKWMMTCVYHYILGWPKTSLGFFHYILWKKPKLANAIVSYRSFTALIILCVPPVYLTLFASPATTDLFIVSILVLPFLECHIVGIIQWVAFSDSLLSLSAMPLRSPPHLSVTLCFLL